MNIRDYKRAVEVSKMRQLMKYGQAQFEEDWKVAQALALLIAGGSENLEPMLDECFQRILAFMANDKYARPF
jgi:hypothetical protein